MAKAKPLERYRDKRSFARTPEPPPSVPSGSLGPLLFVVQKHAARRLHYDFRLELGGVLKSWAVPKGPTLELGEKRLAVEVEDHPFEYASFEGSIPEKQYGAGDVIVWDCGVYSPDHADVYAFDDRAAAEKRVRAELARGKLSFYLRGEKLKGSFALVRTSSANQWLLLKHKDRFAGTLDLLTRSGSVLDSASGNIEASRLAPRGPATVWPKSMVPMLADAGALPDQDGEWLYEPKLDGYRVIAFVEPDRVRLSSRRGIDLTALFPEIVADLREQHVSRMILDGEIVALDADGRPSFNALQNRAQLKVPGEVEVARQATPAVLVCFDLLNFAGIDLRAARYADRRRYLSQCLLPSTHLQLVHAFEDGRKLYDASLASGFEGVVAKRRDSPYRSGVRTSAWIKVKSTRSEEFLVGGFTQGKGGRASMGALLLGHWDGKLLRYDGHVGSGLSEEAIASLREAVVIRKTPAFSPRPALHRPTTWVEPSIVVEVRFDSRTPDGLLRAPVFLRVREDIDMAKAKSAKTAAKKTRAATKKTAEPVNEIEAVLAQLDSKANQIQLAVGGHRIRLTHLDREYWPADKKMKTPAITKRDLLKYLTSVSTYMLPHLIDRPVTGIRMPAGINGERFFQKHWDQARPDFVQTVSVYSEHKSERHAYVLANDLATVLWMGQNGTLEFHVWHSRANVDVDAISKGTKYDADVESLEKSVLNFPDYLVFDIDPYVYSGKEAKGAEPELNRKGFSGGRAVAFWIRELLQEMSLEAIVKTSGKTGLHVFVPIERTVTFDEARRVCELVGRHVEKQHPRQVTMEWAVEKRTGKIFIDYNMNVRGKTLNVAYSPRGVAGAPVSMPLTWEELEGADPLRFRIDNVLGRLAKTGDRWHDVLAAKQSLTHAFGSRRRTWQHVR